MYGMKYRYHFVFFQVVCHLFQSNLLSCFSGFRCYLYDILFLYVLELFLDLSSKIQSKIYSLVISEKI